MSEESHVPSPDGASPKDAPKGAPQIEGLGEYLARHRGVVGVGALVLVVLAVLVYTLVAGRGSSVPAVEEIAQAVPPPVAPAEEPPPLPPAPDTEGPLVPKMPALAPNPPAPVAPPEPAPRAVTAEGKAILSAMDQRQPGLRPVPAPVAKPAPAPAPAAKPAPAPARATKPAPAPAPAAKPAPAPAPAPAAKPAPAPAPAAKPAPAPAPAPAAKPAPAPAPAAKTAPAPAAKPAPAPAPAAKPAPAPAPAAKTAPAPAAKTAPAPAPAPAPAVKKGTKPATKTGEKQQKPARAASVSPAYPTDPFPSLGSLIGRVVEVRPRGEIADAGRVVSLSLSGKVLEWTVMVRDADANWFAIGFSTRHNLGSTDRGDFYWIAARVPGEGPRPALLNGETVLDPELADALRRNRRATLQFGLYLVNGEGREAERTELATDYVDAKVRIR